MNIKSILFELQSTYLYVCLDECLAPHSLIKNTERPTSSKSSAGAGSPGNLWFINKSNNITAPRGMREGEREVFYYPFLMPHTQ